MEHKLRYGKLNGRMFEYNVEDYFPNIPGGGENNQYIKVKWCDTNKEEFVNIEEHITWMDGAPELKKTETYFQEKHTPYFGMVDLTEEVNYKNMYLSLMEKYENLERGYKLLVEQNVRLIEQASREAKLDKEFEKLEKGFEELKQKLSPRSVTYDIPKNEYTTTTL